MNERCFAHRRNGKCVALTSEECTGYAVCPFYKPIWKQAQDLSNVNRKLNQLNNFTVILIHIKKATHTGSLFCILIF